MSQYQWPTPPPGVKFPNWSSNVSRPLPGLPTKSFTETLASLQAFFNQTASISRATIGQLDEMSYRLNSLSDSIDQARSVQTWPVRQSVEHLRSALHDIKLRYLVATDDISIYTLPKNATLAAVSAFLHAPVSDIIKLNPGLFISPVLPKGTHVRYYTTLNDPNQ